jgi:A/G-specific adenine glycosylase
VRHPDALLAWFDRHRRDLPWRQTHDPYRVWLSEVMLQQTRVETVLPFYTRFLERFPTVQDLARAEVEEVLAAWSGLGYYRRARQLHAAARQVAGAGGAFPGSVAGLRALPGIGDYTAAAVASIAFGVAEPVLDGNVERVTARWLALSGDPKSAAVRRRLHEAARELLDPERPGDSNQALMELGATLCTPRRPRCLLCPLRPGCRAAASGDPEAWPTPRRRRAVERHRLLAALVEEPERPGAVLLFRRADDRELLAGTWELPWVPLDDGGPPPEQALAERYGGAWTLGPRLAGVRHGITFRDFQVDVHRAERRAEGDAPAPSPQGYFDEAGRRRLALSSLVGKVLKAAGVPAPT